MTCCHFQLPNHNKLVLCFEVLSSGRFGLSNIPGYLVAVPSRRKARVVPVAKYSINGVLHGLPYRTDRKEGIMPYKFQEFNVIITVKFLV